MTSIRIDGEIIDRAKEIGLNISKTCENALKEAIEALEQRKTKSMPNVGYTDERSSSLPHDVDGRGFEPRTSTMPTSRSFQADLPAQTHT